MKKIGIILISSDYTFVRETTVFCNKYQKFIYSIIPCDNNININSLLKLETKIKNASFPDDVDAIAFACTCASVLIGPEIITNIIETVYPNVPIITPITAALQAMEKLNVKKIALVSPYINEIENIIINYLEDNGIIITDKFSFNEQNDYLVSNIKPDKIADAIFAIAKDAEAVFVSCTNMNFLEQLDKIEKELGKPVISSNQCIIWSTIKASSGKSVEITNYGKLFSSKFL